MTKLPLHTASIALLSLACGSEDPAGTTPPAAGVSGAAGAAGSGGAAGEAGSEPGGAGGTPGAGGAAGAGAAGAGAAGAGGGAPGASWAKRFGNGGFDQGFRVSAHSSGDFLVAGKFEQTVDFGGGPLESQGAGDSFVLRYAPDAVHVWSLRVGGDDSEGSDAVNGVDTAPNGDVVIAGGFSGTMDLGGGALAGAGGDDMFVARFDAAGQHLWSRRFGGAESDFFRDVAVDAAGNAIAGGTRFGECDLGGGVVPQAAFVDAVVAKYDAAGEHLWSRAWGADIVSITTGVAVDTAGNVLATGHIDGAEDFGGGELSGFGDADLFVVSLDPAGAHRWSLMIGGAGSDGGYAIATDAAGNALVAGKIQQSVSIGGIDLQSAGSNDVFVAKLSPEGAVVWARAFGGAGPDRAWDVAATPEGDVLVTGYASEVVDFGTGPLGAAATVSGFVARLDPDGTMLDVISFPVLSPLPEGISAVSMPLGGFGIAADQHGALLFAGAFQGTTDLGLGPLEAQGVSDALVARLVP